MIACFVKLLHNKFKKLMTDTEIFIDSIATNRFNDLNSSLEAVRTDIINQNPDVEEDVPLNPIN